MTTADIIQEHIEGHPCLIYATEQPLQMLIQLTARHEDKFRIHTLEAIASCAPCGFVWVGVPVADWATALMPWADEAVVQNTEAPTHATSTLKYITTLLIPRLQERFGTLPITLGGYSLGALFALWAATQAHCFTAIAAASPSVWIRNWNAYSEASPMLATWVYTSLGNREEHVRNQRMAAVGLSLRQYHHHLERIMGATHTTLHWNKGGHFDHEAQRMAHGFGWCMQQIEHNKDR